MKKTQNNHKSAIYIVLLILILFGLLCIRIGRFVFRPNQIADQNQISTYTGEWFSFQYPRQLVETHDGTNEIVFYPSEDLANKSLVCTKDRAGTVEHPCNEFSVFRISATKRSSNDTSGHKLSLSNQNSSLVPPTTFLDGKNRRWLLEGPVEISGASNLISEYETDQTIYRIYIQTGKTGFERTFNQAHLSQEHVDRLKNILNSFSFDLTNR